MILPLSGKSFSRDDRGQDLSEWCLITALVVLVAFGIFFHVSGGMQNLWTTANTTLVNSAQPHNTGDHVAHTPAHP